MKYNQSGGDKLTLQFDIKLNEVEVINNIKFTENNFGLSNWLTLEELSVSSDNQNYFTVANNVILNPDNNKFSTGFSFTFIPKKVLYVRCRVSQTNPDIDGSLSIGMNNFSLNKILYAEQGTLILKKSIPETNINSIALHLIDSIYDDVSLKINCQLSLDGNTWKDIQPVESSGSGSEIISVNQPWNTDSIITTNPVISVIYLKISFEKIFDQDAIIKLSGSDNFNNTEFLQFPSSSPYSFQLSETANPGSVDIKILSGIKAGSSNNSVTLGNTSSGTYSYLYDLPFDPKGLENVFIGDAQLSKASALDELYDNYQEGYFIDTEKQKIFIFLNTNLQIDPITKQAQPWLVVPNEGEVIKEASRLLRMKLTH